MAAEEDARQRANDERTKQYPIHRSQKPVADARDQGQRHGMGDVGADETGDRGARVQQNESRHTDGAGADRGECHEYPEQERCEQMRGGGATGRYRKKSRLSVVSIIVAKMMPSAVAGSPRRVGSRESCF